MSGQENRGKEQESCHGNVSIRKSFLDRDERCLFPKFSVTYVTDIIRRGKKYIKGRRSLVDPTARPNKELCPVTDGDPW